MTHAADAGEGFLELEFVDGTVRIKPLPKVSPVGDWSWLEQHSGRFDRGSDVTLGSQGDVFACGTYAAEGAHDGNAWVGRFTVDGKLVWFRTYDHARSWDMANAIAAANDGGVFVAGAAKVSTKPDANHHAWLLRLDSDGNKLWSKVVGQKPTTLHMFTGVVAIADGGAIVLGRNYRNGYAGNVWLVRYDSAGNVVWEREISGDSLPDTLNYVPKCLRLAPDGHLYFVVDGTPSSWLYAYSLDGAMIWRHRVQLAHVSHFTCSALDVGVDGLKVAGWALRPEMREYSWMSHFDLSARELWTRTYNMGAQSAHMIRTLASLNDGRTLIAGTRGSPYGGHSAWLQLLDVQGAPAQQRDVAIGYESGLFRIAVSGTGDVVAVGHVQPLVESLPRIWVHKTTLASLSSASSSTESAPNS